jgi:Holliday junction resolvase RusA-like endonuclease
MMTRTFHSDGAHVEIIESYTVPGRAHPAGSKRALPIKGGRFVVVDANRKVRDWQHRVATVVAEGRREAGKTDIIDGPVALLVEFIFERPKSHFGTGKNSDRVKPGSPEFHVSKPDVTKLVRAVEDALTGVVYRDDSQVVLTHAIKRYARDKQGSEARISIGRVEQPTTSTRTKGDEHDGHSDGVEPA